MGNKNNCTSSREVRRKASDSGPRKFMKIIMVLFHICMTVAKTNGICYKCKTGWKISGTMYSNEVIEAAQPVFYNMLIVMFISLVIGGHLFIL